MNHILKSILCCISLCAAATASAQVFIGETEYNTLNAALKEANNGDIIEVKSSISVNAAIGVDGKALTIKGDGDGIVITQSTAEKALVNLKNSGSLTLQNLTFAGNPESTVKETNHINCQAGTSLTLDNVSFKGFKVNVTNGFIRVLTGCKISLTDVTISDNIYPEAEQPYDYDINLVNEDSEVTMAGKCQFNINISNSAKLPLNGNDLDASSKIGVYCSLGSGTEIIKGTSDMQIATLLNGGDRIIAPKIDGETHSLQIITTPAILNAATGVTYADLKIANNDAASGSTLLVYKNLGISNALGANSKTLTFKAAKPGIKLTRTSAKLIINCARFNNESDITDITLDGFVIDGSKLSEPAQQASYLTEGRAGGKATLRNITFTKVWNAEVVNDEFTGSYRSLIRVYPGDPGSYLLDNVKFVDCTVPEGTYHAMANIADKCAVTGDCNFSVGVAKDVSLAADGLTGVINLTAVSPAEGAQIVTGCDDPSRFILTNADWMLSANADGLILTKPLTIADPTVTGDNCRLYPSTDLICVPEGTEATVTFDIPDGATLEYYFEQRDFSTDTGLAASASEWTPYPAEGIKLSGTGYLHLRMTSGTRTAERTFYVFNENDLTGIDDAIDITPARYYDLRGIEIPVDALRPGIYIERRGTATRRIIVR